MCTELARVIMREYNFGDGLILLVGRIFVLKGYNFGVKSRRRTSFASGMIFVPKGYNFGVNFRCRADFTSERTLVFFFIIILTGYCRTNKTKAYV